MRILLVPIITPTSQQESMRAAFATLGEYQEFNWWPYWNSGRIADLRADYLKLVTVFQPELTFLQLQTPDILTAFELKQTSGIGVSWTGDCRQPTPQHYYDTAQYINISLFSNETDVENLRSKGLKADFMNIGFNDDTFKPASGPKNGKVIFLGNDYGNRFPMSAQRREMVKRLIKRYGKQFEVYGYGWDGLGRDVRWLPEPREAQAYQSCSIAICQNHFNDVARFSSDRVFRAMGSGAFLLCNHYPAIEKDFTIGKHLDTWHDLEELERQVDRYLSDDTKREEIANEGCTYVHATQTWKCRMAELKVIIERYG